MIADQPRPFGALELGGDEALGIETRPRYPVRAVRGDLPGVPYGVVGDEVDLQPPVLVLPDRRRPVLPAVIGRVSERTPVGPLVVPGFLLAAMPQRDRILALGHDEHFQAAV